MYLCAWRIIKICSGLLHVTSILKFHYFLYSILLKSITNLYLRFLFDVIDCCTDVMIGMGHMREEIEESLNMHKYDEVFATYHLLGIKPMQSVSTITIHSVHNTFHC